MAEARYCDGDEIVSQQCESISHPLLFRKELSVDQVFFRGRTPPPGVDLASHSPEVRSRTSIIVVGITLYSRSNRIFVNTLIDL